MARAVGLRRCERGRAAGRARRPSGDRQLPRRPRQLRAGHGGRLDGRPSCWSDCPGLKLLVTSREALHVRGEHASRCRRWRCRRRRARHNTAEQLSGTRRSSSSSSAPRRSVRISGSTDENAAAVAEICLRLDGLPLAIELATARINLFSPEALRSAWGAGSRSSASGARDLPERQQTLRATIEWSYQLLDPASSACSSCCRPSPGRGARGRRGGRGRSRRAVGSRTSTRSTGSPRSSTRASSGRPTPATASRASSCSRRSASTRPSGSTTCPTSVAAARRAHAVYFADLDPEPRRTS